VVNTKRYAMQHLSQNKQDKVWPCRGDQSKPEHRHRKTNGKQSARVEALEQRTLKAKKQDLDGNTRCP
jgi:D-lyxose ketol-isomerase